MTKILDQLDLRSLKHVRLVCKSWLREAQVNLEKRGTVRLYTDHPSGRIQKFIEVRGQKITALPQPFQIIDLDLNDFYDEDKHLRQMLLSLCPPLAITRFTAADASLEFVLPLIIECSSTLEYLKLLAKSCEREYSPTMDSKQLFPMLRHLNVNVSCNAFYSNFPSVIAWIAKASRSLEIYESRSQYDGHDVDVQQLTSELVLKVDIQNVKTLSLVKFKTNKEALKHLMSIPFSRLQNVRLMLDAQKLYPYFHEDNPALIPTLKQSVSTLKILDLSDMKSIEFRDTHDLPVFPNVEELTMSTFHVLNSFVSDHFPRLNVLNARVLEIFLGQLLNASFPLNYLKTIRIKTVRILISLSCRDFENKHTVEVMLFDNFPALERLCLDHIFLVRCCNRIATGGHRFSKLFEGLKHLELEGNDVNELGLPSGAGYSSLDVLKGLETITVRTFTEAITSIPVKDLPCLKALKLPWGDCSNVEALLEIARGVERVVITNCCSIPRTGVPECKELLEKFFESAPNAECGCEDKENIPPSHWDKDEDESYKAYNSYNGWG